MALARFKDLCVDARDAEAIGSFWASVLARRYVSREERPGFIDGPTQAHRIWVNPVPEEKSTKNRVHFDVYVASLEEIEALGARRAPGYEESHFTVMLDPEDNEFCAFVRDDDPAERLHGLVVDSNDPVTDARWWAEVYGADLADHQPDGGFSTLTAVPGMPILTMDFDGVPERKVVKNRTHWDVTTEDVQGLLAAGARLVRGRGGDIAWDVLADPAGNEFCAFTPE